jgi:signal transduction histidine kinase
LAFGTAMTLSRVGALPLAYMLVAKGLLTGFGFVASLSLRALYRRVLPLGAPLARTLAVTLAASYAGALAWTAATHMAVGTVAGPLLLALTGAPWRLAPPERLLGLFDGAVYHAFALLAWSVLYVGARYYRAMLAERERALRAEAGLVEARLRALRYQLNPHFLFNALNAVSTLVVERRADDAERMLARLGDFLRLTLGADLDGGADGASEVALAAELDYVARYLAVEQVRFGNRLRVRVDVPDALLAGAVPALLLQPLVENAVRYAVSPREAGGSVLITAVRAGCELRVSVCDDGPGPAAVPAAAGSGADGGCTGGVGLANTRERLRTHYGARPDGGERLALGDAPGGGLRVTVHLPWRAVEAPPPRAAPAESAVTTYGAPRSTDTGLRGAQGIGQGAGR